MKWYTIIFLLVACVIAGLLGALLYNYTSLSIAQKQLAELEANALVLKELNEPLEREIQEVKRKQVIPSIPIEAKLPTGERQIYMAKIIGKIQQNWLVDDSMRGKECRLTMMFNPDGSLLSTFIVSGDKDLCNSALTAVKKGSPYPMSSDPEVYNSLKILTPTLRPELR